MTEKKSKQSAAADLLKEARQSLEALREIYGDVLPGADEDEPVLTKAGAGGIKAEDEMVTLDELRQTVSGCQKCSLGRTRTRAVFGEGNPNADVMFIGEAPGADEDRIGEPFVGRAGQLLTKILAAINFTREEVFIANILKCRPPNNRNPLAEEVEQCEPYLIAQIERIKPRIICALGRVAATTLLKNNISLRELRSKTQSYHGVPLIVTYHPAALLRNPNWKKSTWEDVQKLRTMYDELTASERR